MGDTDIEITELAKKFERFWGGINLDIGCTNFIDQLQDHEIDIWLDWKDEVIYRAKTIRREARNDRQQHEI